MSKRVSETESPRPQKRRQIATIDDSAEEGEVSDDSPGPSSRIKPSNASSESTANVPSFSKIALPFKTKTKPDILPPFRREDSRVNPLRERSRSRGSPPRHDRRRHEDHAPYPPRDYPRPRSPGRDYGRRDDDRWYPPPPDRRGGYERDDYEPRRRGPPLNSYVPSDDSPPRRRPRSSSRSPSKSPRSRGLHRLPQRRATPSPHWRREEEYYRPRSPDYYDEDPHHYHPTYEGPSDARNLSRTHDSPRRSRSPIKLPPISLPPKPSAEILSHPNASTSSIRNGPPQPQSLIHPPPHPSTRENFQLIGPGDPQSQSLVRDGKIQLQSRPRASVHVDANVALLDPDSSTPLPHSHEAPVANFSPMQHDKPLVKSPNYNIDNDDGPAPPTDAPPPLPSPTKSRLPPPPRADGQHASHLSHPFSRPPNPPIVLKKATGTVMMRSPDEEFNAYGRKFVGIDKLSDFEMLNKLGEGTFG